LTSSSQSTKNDNTKEKKENKTTKVVFIFLLLNVKKNMRKTYLQTLTEQKNIDFSL